MYRITLGCLEGEWIERWTGLHQGVQRENGLRYRQDFIGLFRGRMDWEMDRISLDCLEGEWIERWAGLH
jgi:hypothetical protein